MRVWWVLEWILFCKRNKEIFLQTTLIIRQLRLYMKTDTRFLTYIDKPRFKPVFLWSALTRRHLRVFSSFSFSKCNCSCFNYILHVTYYPSLNKLQNTFIKLLQTSHFAIARKSLFFSKRCTPKNVHVWGRSGALEWGNFSLRVPGAGNRPPRDKKWQIPERY